MHRLPALRRSARPHISPFLWLGAAALALGALGSLGFSREEAVEVSTQIEPVRRVQDTQKAASADTIVIKDDRQTIVGQMARIPVIENKNGGDIRTVTNLDKNSGKELLSIVNKY